MRKLITGMKVSLDGMVEGPDGTADWVDAWSDDYGLLPHIDACLLGGGMYPGYEAYWSAIRDAPGAPVWITGEPPTAAELAWSDFAAGAPHYVLSTTLTAAGWPQTSFLRGLDEVTALKQRPGGDIYLVGGARTAATLLDAGLLDEVRLIVHPLVAGGGKALFAAADKRHGLSLQAVERLDGGRVRLDYVPG